MIQASDLKAKTDNELLQIWRDQVDYREDVIAWVKDEIAQRSLDTSAVHVDTLDEKLQSEKSAGTFNWLLLVATLQAVAGFAIIVLALSGISKMDRSSGERGLALAMSILPISIGALLIAIAVGVAKRRKWAFTAAMVVWTFSAALYTLVFLAALTRIEGEPLVVGVIILHIIISAFFARAYHRMRATCK